MSQHRYDADVCFFRLNLVFSPSSVICEVDCGRILGMCMFWWVCASADLTCPFAALLFVFFCVCCWFSGFPMLLCSVSCFFAMFSTHWYHAAFLQCFFWPFISSFRFPSFFTSFKRFPYLFSEFPDLFSVLLSLVFIFDVTCLVLSRAFLYFPSSTQSLSYSCFSC